MTEKKRKENADIPEKEGRFTKHVLKTLLTLNMKSHNHAYITIKIYAPACMHNHVAKPMIHFNLEKNISLPIFHEHKNTK